MKINKNLISVIEKYQDTKDPGLFNQVFEHFQYLIKGVALKYTKNCRLLYDDMVSVLNERLWFCIDNFDSTRTDDVENHLKVQLFRCAIDFTRGKQMTYVNRRIPVDTTAEENAATFESDEHFNLEEYVISRTSGEIKTDHDKRQLIRALTENTDSITTAIVNEHLASERPTYASIGSKVGVHYKKVERVIKGLAKNYDASKYGELNAFLSV
ncbi:hypothetical protein G3M81_04930 [Bacillus paralicheniformis]|uniref:sigma factor n=1 Tax=Bacillus TaxID=1386 RepID=UPI0013EF5640|nr:sigma factor [Bacillus paralicheniformis]QII48117.1 hypothetical protein G3M81_04930 [Bacillus paralicheniformis]